jgi:hypothetical protein
MVLNKRSGDTPDQPSKDLASKASRNLASKDLHTSSFLGKYRVEHG